MVYTQADLALARRHVAEADERIARQRALVLELRRDGHPTATADEFLALLEDTQAQFRSHLVQIAADLGEPP